jgi:hypothetical protein
MLLLLVLAAPLVEACGGGSRSQEVSEPQWEQELVQVVCRSGGFGAYLQPPLLITNSPGQSGLVFSEGDSAVDSLACSVDAASEPRTLPPGARLVGKLARARGDGFHLVALASGEASANLRWIRVPDFEVDGSEEYLGHRFDWSQVPVVKYRAVDVGDPDLEIGFKLPYFARPGSLCSSPRQRVHFAVGSYDVTVTNRGSGAVPAALQIKLNGVLIRVPLRRPIERAESFGFSAPSGARIVVDPGNRVPEAHDENSARLPTGETVDLVCTPNP